MCCRMTLSNHCHSGVCVCGYVREHKGARASERQREGARERESEEARESSAHQGTRSWKRVTGLKAD